jgi:hypothetical protein
LLLSASFAPSGLCITSISLSKGYFQEKIGELHEFNPAERDSLLATDLRH